MIRLTDEQWGRIRKHFPEEHIPDGRPGRKPIPTRHVLEAVLWILNTGAQWHMLLQSYPNSKPPTQDRRRLSRYTRRWLVERFFAWIQWQRRILVRWEYHAQNFLGFV
jgi:transposase